MADFSPKRSTETEKFEVDFINLMTVDATILTATWTISVKSGVDPSPASMIVGSATILGRTQVETKIAAGIPGVIYLPICTITTSDGEVLVLPDVGQGSLPIV
jgi:hypothetical protein